MSLDIPDGTHCFVDANIFHYALVPIFDTSKACLAFLDRAIVGLVSLSVSAQVLADALHKAMTSEAARMAGRDRPGIVGYLNKHPELIPQLVEWPKAIDHGAKIIPSGASDLDDVDDEKQYVADRQREMFPSRPFVPPPNAVVNQFS